MMEVSGSMSSARVNTSSELVTAENRTPAQQLPTATPARQAETIPGVSVQISAAARELAARDRLSEAPESTTETGSSAANAAADTADARSTAAESSEPAANSEQGASAQSAQIRQAIQSFAETAGIGINQQNESPLRTSA